MVEVEPRSIAMLFFLGVALGVFIGFVTAAKRYERIKREGRGR